jgi:hypothetical protein
MDSNPIIPAEVIHLFGEQIALKIHIPEAAESKEEILDLHAIFALDKSGSMSGGPIRDAKGALLSLINKFQRERIQVTIYLFASQFICLSSEELGFEELIDRVEALKAGGGTLFGPVIDDMNERILKNGYENVYCVWLSDGQDNKGLKQLMPFMNKFKDSLDEQGISAAVHTIGFSADHDAGLLNKLCNSGTRTGTFQFVPVDGRIPIAVNNVFELVFESSTWAKFVQSNGIVKKIKLDEDESNDKRLIGTIYVTEQDIQECKLELHRRGTTVYYNIEFQRSETRDISETVYLVTSFISAKIQEALEEGGELTIARLQQIRPLIDEMDCRITDLYASIKKLRVFQRKQLEPYLNTTRDLLNNFYTLLREKAGRNMSNMDLAQLNNLANRTVLKKSLERKIARRAGQNLDFLNKSELEIEEIVKSFNLDELNKQYQGQIDKYGECVISCKNWLDAATEGDCICLTFQLDRPKGGIVDPLQFKIPKINTSLVSVDSFVSSALFLGKTGQIIEGGARFQQDEAPKIASSLVPGLPDEIINGVMPLFICEDHWKIAKLRLRPLIAWDITVDVLGFEYKQLYSLPFMLMAKSYQEADSDFSRLQFEMIRDTCLAIYRDNRDFMLKYNSENINNYILSPTNRLPENLASNSIFLCQVFCAYSFGDIPIEKIHAIFPYLFEEEIRRLLIPPKQTQAFLKKLLGIETEHYTSLIDPSKILASYKTPGSDSLPSYEFTARIENFNEFAASQILEIHNAMNRQSRIYRSIKLFELFNHPGYRSISDSGLVTNEQVLALILQSSIQHDNKTRKEAIEQNRVVPIFDPEAALRYIREVYTNAVRQELLIYRNEIFKKLSSDYQYVGMEFALTSDLNRAASVLKGEFQGNSHFSEFFKALLTPEIPLVIEKCKMLSSGQFNGEKLISDTSKKFPNFITWNPNTKKLFKLWQIHKSRIPLEDFKFAFPERAEYFEHQNLRSQGIFVPYSNPKKNCKDPRHNWSRKNLKPAASVRGRGRGRGRGRP